MTENREVAIQITNLKKKYRLGVIGGGTLQGDIQSWWARIRGREDPNIKIGQTVGSKNETFMALDGIDLTVYKGERLGIIGHNGAGKSTMLKLLSRVTAPTEGKICIDGRISSMLEVGTGFNPELTGRENVYLNGAILGMTKAEVDKKIDQIIEFSECGQFIDTPVKRYSSGMYVKLAFAVAAHLDSEILVMDEVLAVGDMKFQQKCLGKMSDVSQSEGRTVLYVSHNMNTIRQLCDRCIVLNRGKIIFNGAVEEAIERYLGLVNISAPIIDLQNTKRTKNCLDGLKISQIEITSHNAWKIAVGDKIQFNIHVKATKDLDKVSYRMRLSCVDDTSVSVLLARNLISCKSGDKVVIPMEADVSQIIPGKYFLTPALYVTNEYGTFEFYDHMNQAISFEVENVLGFNENMEWDARYWGNVKLPELIDLRQD